MAQLATTVTQLVGDDSLDVTFQTLFPEIPETTEKLTEKPNITKHVKDNFEMLDELGLTIAKVSDNVPGGLLMFFPSYWLMDKVYERWKKSRVLDEI